MSWPNDLSLEWRELAIQQRDLGASPQAHTLEWCADRLEEQAEEWESKALTLEEAAEESGYSYSSLQQMVAEGRLQNAGEKGSPRIRRGDLPRKPRSETPTLETGEPDLAGEILAGMLDG